MEAADGPTNNAKVIVQFTDPSNLFKDVAPLLQNRLPLGNLHWKSPTRPLRSIEELEVSLDREIKEVATGGNTTRRHQIPGLRQTPFVKVLLLRCDDKEQYKEVVRKDVKDWVKALGFSTTGKGATSKQERHDAYEYLILHVVVPGTPAAAQPKSSKHISAEATESTDSVNSKSKWTGKSTSTIFDKLRADFSSSSKTPFERVAQIRLLDSGKPTAVLTPLELEQQWLDLVEKLKAAILHSFGVRVAQYEDDIRERESQRNLPGWNFCTFFILKEGLARGFENVGLLEDALQIYEELDLGLDAVINDQAKADADATNALLPYAIDLKDTIRTVLEKNREEEQPLALSLQAWVAAEANRFPWRLERRDYQNMILTNQVSALDFRIYIFIRQMQILLRQSSLSVAAPRTKNSGRQHGLRWDADLLSEVCDRSVRFSNLAARNLRQDLFAAWGGQQGLPENELQVQRVAIDNIVASWKWASLLQTLAECQVVNSLSALSTRENGNLEDGELFSPKDIANSRMRAESVSTVTSSESINGTTPDIFATLRIVKGSKSGLLFNAAELFTMLRTIFLQLCKQAGMLKYLQEGLSSEAIRSDVVWTGVLAPSLRAMLRSEETALGAYKLLTVCACQCYTSASKSRASRLLLFDLAKLEMHNENHEAAASWLDAVPGFLESPPRTRTEKSMLELYISCLRTAGRTADLVRSMFLYVQSGSLEVKGQVQQIWEEMHEIAKQGEPLEFPFETIFELEQVDDFITHDETEDYSVLALTLGLYVPLEDLGQAEVSVDCQSRGQHLPAKLSFLYHGKVQVINGQARIVLRCPISTEGWYDLVSVTISIGNITYQRSLRQSPVLEDEDVPSFTRQPPTPSVYMYPRNGSPHLEASHAALTDLSAKRKISIHAMWGSNHVSSAQLRLKPATAGLRLDLQSTSSTEDEQNFSITRSEDSHLIEFRSVSTEAQSKFEVPYSVDEPSTLNVWIRAELTYTTEEGSFQLYETLAITIGLPISVNVQDVFQADAVFSRFTVAPSRMIPVSVKQCQLEDNGSFEILDGKTWDGQPVEAFSRQPVNWVVHMREHLDGNSSKTERRKLRLDITYQCFDEIILDTILNSFEAELSATTYSYAIRPLKAHLRSKLQTLWTETDVETCALTGEVEMWEYEMLDWSTLLHAFKRSERRGLESQIRDWHEKLYESPLLLETENVVNRVLRLGVDPPETQVVITTDLKISSQICTIGCPMMAKLIISAKAFLSNFDLDDVDIILEIPSPNQSTSENWLIGGLRKASFQASKSRFESTIFLVPQKTGSLLLPGIEVRCTSRGEGEMKPIAFEMEHLSAAVSVEVRNAIESTTLGVGDTSEGTERHWLIGATMGD